MPLPAVRAQREQEGLKFYWIASIEWVRELDQLELLLLLASAFPEARLSAADFAAAAAVVVK